MKKFLTVSIVILLLCGFLASPGTKAVKADEIPIPINYCATLWAKLCIFSGTTLAHRVLLVTSKYMNTKPVSGIILRQFPQAQRLNHF